jgi:PAS domain S-box-containing protein
MEHPSTRVLLVEHDPRYARVLRLDLAAYTTSRIELIHCTALAEALQRLQTPGIDALLLDLELPGESGLEAFARLQAGAPAMPVIVLTDFDNETLALQAVRAGAQDYLVKSRFDGRLLPRVIRYAIERKETARRLAAQCAMVHALADAPDLESAACGLVAAAGESLGCDLVALWTADGPGGAPRCCAVWDRPGAGAAAAAARLRDAGVVRESPWLRRVVAGGEAHWRTDLAGAELGLACEAGSPAIQTVVGVPIASDHRVLGAIGLFLCARRAPDRTVLQLLTTAGDQFGQFMRRKEEEAAHRSVEARLQAILDNTTAVIYLKDTAGRYLLANRQFEALFGLQADRILHRTDAEIFPPDVAARFQANDRQVLAARRSLVFEEVAPHPDGLHTYISIKFPLGEGSEVAAAVCGISTDITERKRAETQLVCANAELRTANEGLSRSQDALRKALAQLQASHDELKAAQLQLIRAEKLESIGTLAAGVAHEVKNPLQTILMGVAYLTSHAAADDENQALVLTEIRDAIARADSIVRELVAFSASNQPEVRSESLNAIVEQSLGMMRYELTRGQVRVVKELGVGLPELALEKNKIQQAFINLFLNAIQAMPRGGVLTVRTFACPADGQQAAGPGAFGAPAGGEPADGASANGASANGDGGDGALRADRARRVVVAEVEDTGEGIPAGHMKRLFDPFFTTKPCGLGSGLGLSVTQRIVELHGGSIRAASRPEGGARFTVVFPSLTEGQL